MRTFYHAVYRAYDNHGEHQWILWAVDPEDGIRKAFAMGGHPRVECSNVTYTDAPLALDPYVEGMMDFDDGVSLGGNPYPEDNERSSLWIEGWMDAAKREE